ncbi:MAG: hypothetical protein NTU43_08770 [Bacteroidetes bacterium]|nr:hypothetical protein [Bacteroidota bacterium]
MSRIILPRNPDDVLALMDSIIKKEESLAPKKNKPKLTKTLWEQMLK